jgi:hypothetical protein
MKSKHSRVSAGEDFLVAGEQTSTKNHLKEVRKTGRANKQTSAKDGRELPKRNRGRRKEPRWVTRRANKTNF